MAGVADHRWYFGALAAGPGGITHPLLGSVALVLVHLFTVRPDDYLGASR
jgi:hypothetical protein